MKKTNRVVSMILALVLLFSAVPTTVFAGEFTEEVGFMNFNSLAVTNSEKIVPDKYVVEEIFRLIEETPDDVLMRMSESEIIEYFNKNSNIIHIKDKETAQGEYAPMGWWENTKCGAAVIIAIGGTVFVGAKLLQFKKYIAALGGAKEAAYLVYLYFTYGQIPDNLGASLGGFLVNLAEMILGIDQIKEQCGHLFSSKNVDKNNILC